MNARGSICASWENFITSPFSFSPSVLMPIFSQSALMRAIEIKPSIRAYGIKEEDFLATLDEMTENAFNDQCTGANPRYPLMSEIKDLYLQCYYKNADAADAEG